MRVILAFLIVVLFASVSFAQNNGWERVGAIQFTSVARQSPSKIVLTTSHGYLYSSTDKGNSWLSTKLDDTLYLVDIAFADSLHGVVIDHYSNVLLTADGGNSWKYSLLPQFSIANHVAYPSPDSIFICDSLGKLWRSVDRGNSWKIIYQSPFGETPDYALQALHFSNSKIGFVAGAKGIFLKTTDGGENWKRPNIGTGDSIPLFCMDFFDRNIGVAAGWNHYYTTTDGGENWKSHRLQDSVLNFLYTVRLTSDHDFFAFGPSGQVYLSADFGETMRVPLINAEEYSSANGSISDSKNGTFVVGGAGLVLFSSNGKDWIPKNQCAGGVVEACGNGIIHSVGSDPFFSTSINSGLSWNGAYTNTLFFVGLHFTSRDSGFLIQQTGDCKKTTDGGQTWQQLSLGVKLPKGAYTSSSFKKDVGYILSNQSIIRTTDNGSSWLRVDPVLDSTTPYKGISVPLFWTFLSIQSLDQEYGFASMYVSDSIINPMQGQSRYGNYHSLLYYTTNAGSSWNVMKSAPALPRARFVFFKNRMNGFLGCDSGVLYQTFDGGLNWTKLQITPAFNVLKAINFVNDSIGFLSTTDDVFFTYDGGKNWTKDHVRIPSDFNKTMFDMFVFPDSNTVLARDRSNVFYRKTIKPSGQSSVKTELSSNIFQYLYISAYPQPCHNSMHCLLHGLYSAPNALLQAGVYDILGRQILDLTSIAINNNNGYISEFTIDVSPLAKGAYTLIYSLGTTSCSSQFVVF